MERAGQALAATRAGRVAITLERYRRRRGKLPGSVTDLASPLPADPFSGHDLLYRRAEDSFVVASVGPARTIDARAVDEKGRPQGISVCFARPADEPPKRLRRSAARFGRASRLVDRSG